MHSVENLNSASYIIGGLYSAGNSRSGSGCSKAESRGATSDFFGLLLLSVPGRCRGAQKTVRSRFEISRTLGFVSSSARGSCDRNRHRRRGSRCSKAESRGVTSDFFGQFPPSVPGRGREAQKTVRSRIEMSRTLGFVSSSLSAQRLVS